MTTSPKIRDKVSISAGNKNRSLKDILAPMGAGVEVLKVEAINAPMHNTKATIRIDNSKITAVAGEYLPTERYSTRVIFYNRIDIATILPETITAPLTNLAAVLEELNSKHQCDFTEDDIEATTCGIKAKETSLGYYSSGAGVGSTIPTDTVSFGVRTLPSGVGDKSEFSIHRHQKIVVSVNGVVYDPEPIENGGNAIPTMDLVGWVKRIFANHFPLIKTTILPTLWFEDFYHGQGTDEAAIIELTNLDNTTPMDVTVQLHTLDQDGGYILKNSTNLLPNARLQPAGSTIGGCGGVDNYTLTENEYDFRYNPYSEENLGRSDEDVGKLVGLNGSTHGVFLETVPTSDGDFTIDFFEGNTGLQNVLRVYRRPVEGYLENSEVLVFLKNLMETPLTLKHPALSTPLVFTKTETETPLDQIMVSPIVAYSYNKRRLFIQVGEVSHNVNLEDERWGDLDLFQVIDGMLETIPAIANSLTITLLEEICRKDVYLYVKNKTATALNFGIWYTNSDGIISDVIPHVVLEPSGTKGLGYTVDDQIYTTNSVVTGMVNNRSIRSITWRGVTTLVELSSESDIKSAWRKSIWSYILIASARRGATIDYFHSRSPFKEEFIFNKGLPDEVKFHLEPKQLVDATAVPS